MRMPRALPGGDLERAVLAELWGRGQATVRELHEAVGMPRRLVYTTVAKVLDRLVAKRIARRHRMGRAYVYKPLVERLETERALARRLIGELLGNDPQPVAAALLGAIEEVSPELLDELATELANRKAGR